MDSIEKIYVISRPCDADTRMACVLRQFRALGIKNVTHFVAIEPDFNDPFYENLRKSYQYSYAGESYQKNSLGCSLSHIGVCKAALAAGYKRIMVFEDDVWLSSTFVDTVNQTVQLLDTRFPGWAVLNLETNDAQPQPSPQMQVLLKKQNGDALIVRTFGNYGLAGYVVNEEAMRLVADEAIAYGRETDIFYAMHVYKRLPCYIIPNSAALVQGAYVSTATGVATQSRFCPYYNIESMDIFQPPYDASKVKHFFDKMQTAWDWSHAEII